MTSLGEKWVVLSEQLTKLKFEEILRFRLRKRRPFEQVIFMMSPRTSMLITVTIVEQARNFYCKEMLVWGFLENKPDNLHTLFREHGISGLADFSNPGESAVGFYGRLEHADGLHELLPILQKCKWLPWPYALTQMLRAYLEGWGERPVWQELKQWVQNKISDPYARPVRVAAITADEHELYGCPHCGSSQGQLVVEGVGMQVWRCGNSRCDLFTAVLQEGITRSPLAVLGSYPELQPHPRRLIAV